VGKKSAGILLYRFREGLLEVFLVHPGGPFYRKRDLGIWSIPKGEYTDEEPFEAAKREFLEETGFDIDWEVETRHALSLNPIKLQSGKILSVWAIEKDVDATTLHSNNFMLEWPPKSGKFQEFEEVDKGAWLTIPEAKEKIGQSQIPLLDQLINKLGITNLD
jgi:predicted NUDIX family NTP pyrophosphohydrolase